MGEIENNIRAHRRVATSYVGDHGEIYNPIEQTRLRASLERALAQVRSGGQPLRAFDYGCGAGNLTEHLLALGCATVSADVTDAFLEQIAARYATSRMSTTALLNGEDLREFPDASFDLVATYSVLHHVPDYLRAVGELARVVKPGGVLFIDHEAAPSIWDPSPDYRLYLKSFLHRRSLRKRIGNLLDPRWYVLRARLLLDPRYQPEGDIHVWPDDHIEWDRIAEIVVRSGFEVLEQSDYLLYRRGCPEVVYERFRTRCVDSRLFIARRTVGQ